MVRVPDRNMAAPTESSDDIYINDMVDTVKRLNTQIKTMTEELVLLNDFRYFDLGLKEQAIDSYNEKINNRQSELDGIKRNLANGYGVYL